MARFIGVAFSAGLLAIGTLAMSAGASAQEARLRLVSFLPGNASFGIPAKRWVDELNRRGKGVLQVDFVGPEAVPVPEQANAVKTGVVDLHSGPPTFYRGSLIEGETLSLSETSIPELKKNGVWDTLNKLHAEKLNVMLLTGFGDGVRFHIYTTKAANTADKVKPFAGFTLRSPPIYKVFFESLGAQVVSTAPGEVYTALERGMVQGYGWPLWGIKDFGWIKLTKFRYDPGFYNVSVNIMINLDRYKKLDKKQQDLIGQMATWMDTEWPKWRAEFEAQEEKIQKDGNVQVVSLGPDLRTRAHTAFWTELETASPKIVPGLKKLMTK
ncbi:MAG: ABC transporter substrate-binding protein [Betaproteobacteria bacterium]|nr:ABC transporter substrate-binding protein [Betaproteobacteria bacterium]